MALANAIKIIGRRMLKRPMTDALLLEYSAGLMAKPPFPPGYREIYDITITADGRNLLDVWRDEYVKIVQNVTTQPAWSLQKRKLLWHLVKEAGWMALADVVTEEHDVRSWSSFVEGMNFFQDVEDTRRLSMLTQRKLLALPTSGILYVTGMAAFGLTDKDQAALNVYKAHRTSYITIWVGLLNSYHCWDSSDPDGAEHCRQAVLRMGPLIEETKDLAVKIGNSIVDGAFNPDKTQQELNELDRKKGVAFSIFDIETMLKSKAHLPAGQTHKI